MLNVLPIPGRIALFTEPAGRPGDWWEPSPFSASEAAVDLCAEAHRRRLPLDLLVTLLVERTLIERDVDRCGIDGASARAALADAVAAQPMTGPGRLHTAYVRMLCSGEDDYERESDAHLAGRVIVLPLRLHDAIRSLDPREVDGGEPLDEAIAWEIAAATSGQFMREWALRILLAQATRA